MLSKSLMLKRYAVGAEIRAGVMNVRLNIEYCTQQKGRIMMTYAEVQKLILMYAPEMAEPFADRFERFPEGGNAAMIANYLNDRASFYYNINERIAKKLAKASAEIVVRCG